MYFGFVILAEIPSNMLHIRKIIYNFAPVLKKPLEEVNHNLFFFSLWK